MKKAWIIILMGFLVYGFSLSNGFVWDIEALFQSGDLKQFDAYFRPALSLIYLIIYNLFGQRPFFFHLFQLIFHVATSVLLFYFFKHFFKEFLAFILALIFLVHPASVEAVSLAMSEILFTLTGIIGLCLFVILSPDESREQAPEGIQTKMDSRFSRNDIHAQVFFATLLLLVALFMKETAIVFFVLVYCYLFLFKKNNQVVLINYSIFAVILLMTYFLLRLSSGSLYVQGQGLFPIMRVSLITRLINIPSIVEYYFKMFFYPINLAIAQHWVVKSISFVNFFLPLIVEAFIFMTAIIYLIKNKDKVFFFFLLWFLIGLLPHLQIIPINMTVAERWLYFPMIGLLGMIGAVLNKSIPIKSGQISKILFGFAVIIIFIFSIRSFIRTLDWRSGLTLFSHDIKKDSSFDLQNNFGTELFRVGRYKEAKKYFEISVKLAPYWWVNWNNLGVIYERDKNYEKAAEYYQKAINNGQYYLAYENLAKILVFHSGDQKKTEEFLKEALRLFPKSENLIKISDFYFLPLNERK